METKKCENCGQEFIARRSDAKYCNSRCRSIFWQSNKSNVEDVDLFHKQLKGVVLDNTQALKKSIIDQSSSKNNNELILLISAIEKEAKDLEEKKTTLTKQLQNLTNFFYDFMQYLEYDKRVKDEKIKLHVINERNIDSKINNINSKIAHSSDILWKLGEDDRKHKRESAINAINVSLIEINVKLTVLNPVIDDLKKLVIENKAGKPGFNDDIEIIPDNTDIQVYTSAKETKISNPINVNDFALTTVKTHINANTNNNIISSAVLSEMEYQALDFQGAWNHLFGFPSINFHCVIHGMSGEGKSTFAIQFAKYLAENFGIVIYVSGEEGFSKTMKDKLVNNNATSENLYLADLRTFQDLVTQVKPNTYNFIFIDSLDNMRIGALELKEIRVLYKNSAIVTISQSTKDGKMKGSNEIMHDSDIAVSVSNGIAITVKNRFLEKGRSYKIFTKSAEPEIKPRNTFKD